MDEEIKGLIGLTIYLIVLISLVGYFLYKRRLRTIKRNALLSQVDLQPFLENLDLQKEERVRKQWLISLLVLFSLNILSIGILYFRGNLENEFTQNFSPLLKLMGFISPLLVSLLWCWISYFCAYKERGTTWLMLIMIIIALSEFATIQALQWNQIMAGDWLPLVSIGLGIYFWMTSFRLYKVNSARKSQRALALKAKYGDNLSSLIK